MPSCCPRPRRKGDSSVRAIRRIALLLATTLCLAARPASAQPPRVVLVPCHPAGFSGEARCGHYDVYEDRAAGKGRTISLNIVVLPARRRTAAPDPVFWLHGGPGAAATTTVPAAENGFLAGLLPDRDLVFVDQRGTGASHPLTCDLADDPTDLQRFFGPLLPPERVRQCREQLEKTADLRLYTTPIAVDDLDEVRAALGYDKINLVAASYGSIAAQVYMRRHPQHVRAVFLVGVANLAIKQPLPFAKGAQAALDYLFQDCAADTACRSAYPDLPKEFAAVLRRFDRGPVTATLLHPVTRRQQTVQISRASFVEYLRLMLYTTRGASFVPLVIHRTYQGDYVSFEAAAIAFDPARLVARGMYLSVTCAEGVPFISKQDLVTSSQGTFVGPARVRAHIAACKEWTAARLSRSYLHLVHSQAPVLVISGQVDGSTPPWMGREAMAGFANGRQVVIRYYGHQLDSPCVWGILRDFIAKGSAKDVDTSCTEQIRRPPFAMRFPKDFPLQ